MRVYGIVVHFSEILIVFCVYFGIDDSDFAFHQPQKNNSNQEQEKAQSTPVDDGKPHKFSKEIREKLNDLHKFLTNLLNVIQVLLKDMSVGLLGTYQEVRYEMIKYLYKCAKQF